MAPKTRSPFLKEGDEGIVFVPVTEEMLKEHKVLEWPIWEKEVCQYDYTYEIDEDVYFLEGEVIVTPVGGAPVTIKAGDFAVLPAGMSCEWKIVSPVRKHYKEYE